MRRLHGKARAGFSLVEVLIAILVLALGLLGLGAVFPVILNEQRNSFNATEGERVAEVAEGFLRGETELIDSAYLVDQPSLGAPGTGQDNEREWVLEWTNASGFNSPYQGWPGVPSYDLATGAVLFKQVAGGAAASVQDRTLPMSARVFPLPDSGVDPRYVWDFVVRRAPGTERTQVAVFVRAIELRRTAGSSVALSDLLTGDGVDRLFPVSLSSANFRPAVAREGLDPDDFLYSIPQFIGCRVDEDELDTVILEGGNGLDQTREYLRRPGQMFVDNTGVVRTVVRVNPENRDAVIVDPPFRLENASDGASVPANPGNDAERASWVRQIVFTPQTPAAIRVFSVDGE